MKAVIQHIAKREKPGAVCTGAGLEEVGPRTIYQLCGEVAEADVWCVHSGHYVNVTTITPKAPNGWSGSSQEHILIVCWLPPSLTMKLRFLLNTIQSLQPRDFPPSRSAA
jgi:hypothetical protein